MKQSHARAQRTMTRMTADKRAASEEFVATALRYAKAAFHRQQRQGIEAELVRIYGAMVRADHLEIAG